LLGRDGGDGKLATKDHGPTITKLAELGETDEAKKLALVAVKDLQDTFLADLGATKIRSLQRLAENDDFKKKVWEHFEERQGQRARPPVPPSSPDVSPLITRLTEAGAHEVAQKLAN